MSQAQTLSRPAAQLDARGVVDTRRRPVVTRVDLLRLPEDERDALIAECLRLDKAVFPDAADADLEPVLRDPEALAILMVLMRSPEGELVGQVIHPIVPVETERGMVAVMGGIAGVLPAWRGGGRSTLQAAPLVLGWVLRNPRWRLYFATSMMTPKVYQHLVRCCPRMHPRPDTEMPAELAEILAGLAASDPSLTSRGPDAWVRDDLPPPHVTASERRRIDPSRPLIGFYLDRVPDYACGRGLMVITPIRAVGLVEIACTSALRLVHKALRRTLG